jgi:glutamine amidotransferase
MKNLEKNMLKEIILNKINVDKIPVLGICLGMQLMTNFSEEGNINGLGLIDLKVDKIKSNKLKIPHMGWNTVDRKQDLRLFKGIDDKETFYFVHSYYINEQKNNYKCGYTNYESKFISTYEKNNIFGVQFHPEKSHDQGLQLISNFKDI